jgi:hypothetical protein
VINPTASLDYHGTKPNLDVSFDRSLGLVGPWIVEQLDGDLYIGNGASLLMSECGTIPNDDVQVFPYDKPEMPVNGPPEDPRLKALYDDPVLHLPAGTWRIWVRSSFRTACGAGDADQVALTASVVIVVQ